MQWEEESEKMRRNRRGAGEEERGVGINENGRRKGMGRRKWKGEEGKKSWRRKGDGEDATDRKRKGGGS